MSLVLDSDPSSSSSTALLMTDEDLYHPDHAEPPFVYHDDHKDTFYENATEAAVAMGEANSTGKRAVNHNWIFD